MPRRSSPPEIAAAKQLGMFERLDLVALNEAEGAELIGPDFSADDLRGCMDKCVDYLRRTYPHLHMVISCGKNGAYELESRRAGTTARCRELRSPRPIRGREIACSAASWRRWRQAFHS